MPSADRLRCGHSLYEPVSCLRAATISAPARDGIHLNMQPMKVAGSAGEVEGTVLLDEVVWVDVLVGVATEVVAAMAAVELAASGVLLAKLSPEVVVTPGLVADKAIDPAVGHVLHVHVAGPPGEIEGLDSRVRCRGLMFDDVPIPNSTDFRYCLISLLPSFTPALFSSCLPSLLPLFSPTFVLSCPPSLLAFFPPAFLPSHVSPFLPFFIPAFLPAFLHFCLSLLLFFLLPAYLHVS